MYLCFIKVVENGELLIETEPVKYELRQIVYDKFRTQVKRNKTLLGQTVLMNEDDKENNVEAVITYMFGKFILQQKLIFLNLLLLIIFRSNKLFWSKRWCSTRNFSPSFRNN